MRLRAYWVDGRILGERREAPRTLLSENAKGPQIQRDALVLVWTKPAACKLDATIADCRILGERREAPRALLSENAKSFQIQRDALVMVWTKPASCKLDAAHKQNSHLPITKVLPIFILRDGSARSRSLRVGGHPFHPIES